MNHMFQDCHPLYLVPLLRNQMTCTLATLLAASALSRATSEAMTEDIRLVDQICQENISEHLQLFLSILDDANDTSKRVTHS